MHSKLKSMRFSIGHLRRSQKQTIVDVLQSQMQRQAEIKKKTGYSSVAAMTEVNDLVLRLLRFYRVEKGFEGTDRLFSAGREMAEIFEKAEMFDLFEKSLVGAFRKDFREKLRKDTMHTLYLGKARALMQGVSTRTEEKFDSMLEELKIEDDSNRQTSLLDDRPTLH